MSSELPRDQRHENWANGTPLGLAWLKFGDERRLQQHAMKRGDLASVLIEDTIMGDVFGRLATGQLLAWGFRVAPIQGDGPIPIPPDVFDQRPPDTWRDDVVIASGERFERITICEPLAEVAGEGLEFPHAGHGDDGSASRASSV